MEKPLNQLIRSTIVLLLFVACSTGTQSFRSPASAETELLVENVFSFKLSTDESAEDQQKAFKKLFGKDFSEIVLDETLDEGVAFKVDFAFEDGSKKIKLRYSKKAFTSVAAINELMNFMSNSSANGMYLGIVEITANAKKGDLTAIEALYKMRALKNKNFLNYLTDSKLKKEFENRSALLEKRFEEASLVLDELKDPLAEKNKVQKERELSRKEILDSLDGLESSKQFKNLVANNDRKGVSELLKSYLPFEQMAPVEKEFWTTYLEVIKNPVPLDKRVLIFRGLNDDMVYGAMDAGKGVLLEKEDAIKEGKAFFMSPVIVKNQGSWNRRLRSLQTMNEKYIGTIDNSSEYSKSARITTMFGNHSKVPQGSPFLSFTPDFNIATFAPGKYGTDFGSARVAMFLFDPRLLHYNYATTHDEEIEFLTGLCTFPDELASIWDINYHAEDPQKFLYKKMKEKLTSLYPAEDAEKIYKDILQRSRDFYSPVFDLAIPGTVKRKAGLEAALKTVLESATVLKSKIPQAGSPAVGGSCNDMMKTFVK